MRPSGLFRWMVLWHTLVRPGCVAHSTAFITFHVLDVWLYSLVSQALRSPSSRAIATDLEIGATLARAASRLSDGEAAEVVHEFERLLAASD